MTPMRPAALALLLLAAPSAALVRIEPAAPAVGEPVQVQVFGYHGNPCFTLAATRRTEGDAIAIDIALTQLPGLCPQVVASWVVVENLGPLAAGPHAVVVHAGAGEERVAFEVGGATPTPTATPYPACFGDCDGSGSVGIDEVVRLVSAALAGAAPDCAAVDAPMRIDALTAVVRRAMLGCATVATRDLSEFVRFDAWSQPFSDLAPCPFVDPLARFAVAREPAGGYRLTASGRRLVAPTDACARSVFEHAVVDGMPGCATLEARVDRPLADAEAAELLTALRALPVATAPDPDCGSTAADSCAPHWFTWGMETLTDRACAGTHLTPDSSRALLSLLRRFAESPAAH